MNSELGGILLEFEKRAKSVLWRLGPQGKDAEHRSFNDWKEQIATLASRPGVSRRQALVRVSKEHPQLQKLMMEYDFSALGLNDDKLQEAAPKVICEEKEQSYREDLKWAKMAAGRYLRTKVKPIICPNDSAWYLYSQALSDPRDFLTRVGQIESKANVEDESVVSNTRFATKSLEDIDDMLSTLEEYEQEEE